MYLHRVRKSCENCLGGPNIPFCCWTSEAWNRVSPDHPSLINAKPPFCLFLIVSDYKSTVAICCSQNAAQQPTTVAGGLITAAGGPLGSFLDLVHLAGSSRGSDRGSESGNRCGISALRLRIPVLQ